jgi:uncharacterized membrane protein HdeD (DUF308 family)
MMTFPAGYPWWSFALRGVLAILFGIVAIIWPGLTLGALVILFGAYALVDGIFALVAMVTDGGHGRWLPLLLVGLAGVVAGILTLVWPGLSALALIYVVAAWAVVIGVLQVVAAIQLRREITGELWLALSGVVSVLVGLFFFAFPGDGAVALVIVIGIYAIIFGVALVALGLRLRARGGSTTGSSLTGTGTPGPRGI